MKLSASSEINQCNRGAWQSGVWRNRMASAWQQHGGGGGISKRHGVWRMKNIKQKKQACGIKASNSENSVVPNG